MIPHRWWIGGLLFASTVINYIDRQTLAVLAPYLKTDYHWNNEDFAKIIVAFRIAYALGQTFAGRFLDKTGTRNGLTVSVLWYSIAAMATSLANSLTGFCGFRFALGLGESANWPGATKAVREYFPPNERTWAVALFDSGSSVGAAIAPVLVLWLYHWTGGWRAVFLITGALGFLWLIAWRALSKETPALSMEDAKPVHWPDLFRMPETWAAILSRGLTDPVWFFITDWLAIYLVARGFKMEESLLAFWIPFAASDLGNFAGGGASSYLVRRGVRLEWARKAIAIPGALGMCALVFIPAAATITAIAALFATATFCYSMFSTIAITLPADFAPARAVATVSGMSGTAAGLGTIACTFIVGYVSDHYSFAPILMGATVFPLLALTAMMLLVGRTRRKTI